jgi:hypothetical protein
VDCGLPDLEPLLDDWKGHVRSRLTSTRVSEAIVVKGRARYPSTPRRGERRDPNLHSKTTLASPALLPWHLPSCEEVREKMPSYAVLALR